MKKLALLSIFSLFLFACSTESHSEESVVSTEVLANAEAKFMVEGMTCEVGCAARIQDKLSKMEGVALSEVTFETKEVLISYDNKIVTESDFKKMIEGLNDNQYKIVTPNATNEIEGDDSEGAETGSDLGQALSLDFELPNILDFFTNII